MMWFQVLIIAILLGLQGWGWYHWQRPLPDAAELGRWVTAGRAAEALPVLQARLERSPHDGASRQVLARIYAQAEDYLRCAETLEEVPFWWSTVDEARRLEGQAWILAHRARAAERVWRTYLEGDPQHPQPRAGEDRILVDLLNLWALEDRWDEIAQMVWRLYPMADARGRHELRVMSLRTILERSSPRAALATVQAYVEADPGDQHARLALARFALALGNTDLAKSHLALCLQDGENHPNLRGVWRVALELAYASGDLIKLEQMLESVPQQVSAVEPEVWRYRGLLAQRQGDLPAARAALLQAIARGPYQTETQYRLATILEALGETQRAQTHRATTEALRQARTELPEVLKTHTQTVRDRGLEAHADLLPTARKLAELCRTLGLLRDAHAWGQYAQSLGG